MIGGGDEEVGDTWFGFVYCSTCSTRVCVRIWKKDVQTQ